MYEHVWIVFSSDLVSTVRSAVALLPSSCCIEAMDTGLLKAIIVRSFFQDKSSTRSGFVDVVSRLARNHS